MKKRGKQFKAKKDPNAFMRVIMGVKPLSKSQQTEIGIAYHMAFDSMRKGVGQEGDFHTIACSLNIALILSERGYGTDWIDQIKAAQAGLIRCLIRGQKTGSWGLDGPAMTVLAEALALHDEQIELATGKEIREAIAEVHRRVIVGEVLKTEKL